MQYPLGGYSSLPQLLFKQILMPNLGNNDTRRTKRVLPLQGHHTPGCLSPVALLSCSLGDLVCNREGGDRPVQQHWPSISSTPRKYKIKNKIKYPIPSKRAECDGSNRGGVFPPPPFFYPFQLFFKKPLQKPHQVLLWTFHLSKLKQISQFSADFGKDGWGAGFDVSRDVQCSGGGAPPPPWTTAPPPTCKGGPDRPPEPTPGQNFGPR